MSKALHLGELVKAQSMPSLQSELVIQVSEGEFHCKKKINKRKKRQNQDDRWQIESPKATRAKWKAWVINWKEECSPQEPGCVRVVGAVVSVSFPSPKMGTWTGLLSPAQATRLWD